MSRTSDIEEEIISSYGCCAGCGIVTTLGNGFCQDCWDKGYGRNLLKNKDHIELKLDILEFAFKHNLKINPAKDLDGFCKRAVELEHCSCQVNVLVCPCPRVLELCVKDGYCVCKLFMMPELYPEALASARTKWKRKKERKDERAKSGSFRREALQTMRRNS